MAYIYYRLIQLKKKSILDVPENLKQDVIDLIANGGE